MNQIAHLFKGAFATTRGEAKPHGRHVQESQICQARQSEAVPRGIACQIVQYVHSGTIHTFISEAARNTILFLHARVLLASECYSLARINHCIVNSNEISSQKENLPVL